MTEQNTSGAKPCGRSFNYCLVAKLVVAIPALPIIAYVGAMPFKAMALKLVGSLAAVAFTVFVAIKVDEIPALQKMIVRRPTEK